ncbi:MAG: isoleucine--tRNA ligase [Candidatus Anstonellales archaeon]
MYPHNSIENGVLQFWEKEKIYEKAKKKNRKGKRFYFVDGPPYATGQIHPGTAWNKAIKDAMCRYYRMKGYNVRAQAGYDTHGLPIEVKVEKELEIKKKNEIEEKFGIEKFISECKNFADKYIEVMTGQFKSVGVWMDWDNPYITYKDGYIEKSWETLKMAYDKGLMHQGEYVLPYCYRCETTLANYELEYDEESDPSIFVKFKVKGKSDEFLLVWTTTPWTLVSNMACMVHPDYDYVKVMFGEEAYIFAKGRMHEVERVVGKSGIIIEEMKGKDLEGLEYDHPFQNKIKKEYKRRVVLSDRYVTLEEGTGIVHTAPGHGPEDFAVGKEYGIEIFSPVDGEGRYTDEAGEFAGMNVREANPKIIEVLKESGALVHEERVRHRYPHCWRCKTPLIFIATTQWFIDISKLKNEMLAEAKKINWVPEFGKERFLQFVENAPDWCISRQRYWGIPLPIWRCEKCGETKVVGKRKELPEKVKELHRPYVDKVKFRCKCGGEMKRVPDVLDVWFDSGNAMWAELTDEEAKYWGEISDLIIEGHDQIRGWFYSLLGSGIVRYGKAPYRNLMMHGFFVDEKGEKMSKSLGNFVPIEEILQRYGADAFRLWGLSNPVYEDLKFMWEEMKEASDVLNIVYNLELFLERNYNEKKVGKKAKPAVEDRWLISRMNSVLKEYNDAFVGMEPHRGVKALKNFIVEDFSRFYMKLAKDRVADGDSSAMETIYDALLFSIKLLAPISPFISEYIYQRFYRKYEKEESVHFLRIGKEDKRKIDDRLEEEMEIARKVIASGLMVRQNTGVKLRWPLRKAVFEAKDEKIAGKIKSTKNIIAKMLNVKEFIVGKGQEGLVSGECEYGKIYIDKEVSEELYEEAIVKEVLRRIQQMRKEMGLVERDRIEVFMDGESEVVSIARKNSDEIKKRTRAERIEFGPFKEEGKEWDIDGKKVDIFIKKL